MYYSMDFDQITKDHPDFQLENRPTLFQRACHFGSLVVIKILVENYGFTVADIQRNTTALLILHKSDKLDIIQYLADLGVIFDHSYIYIACEFGHFELVQFLVIHLQLKLEDFNTWDGYTFLGYACIHNNINIAKWLAEKFNITMFWNEEIENILEISNLATIKWVISYFKINKNDFRDFGYAMLESVFRNDNLDVMWWVIEEFDFTVDDIKSIINRVHLNAERMLIIHKNFKL